MNDAAYGASDGEKHGGQHDDGDESHEHGDASYDDV